MKIVVVAVAAESGGALSILKGLHAAALVDSSVSWAFVTSLPELTRTSHVGVTRCPWIKRSWVHRMWFDHIVLPKLLDAETPDVVVSLHNVPVRCTDARKVVYLHQALPFSTFQFQLPKDPKLWFYQKVTAFRIIRGLRKQADFVVQTAWMQEAVSSRRGQHLGRVVAIPPPPTVGPSFRANDEPVQNAHHLRFFYPAGALAYKNHKIIVDATKVLESSTHDDFEVVLTLTAEEFLSLGIGRPSPRFRLIGHLTHDQVMKEYQNSTLIFPSLVETVGLPLVEAMMTGASIIAADLPYAREQIEGYEGATFVEPTDAEQLASAMRISLTIKERGRFEPWLAKQGSSWRELIAFFKGDLEY